MKTGPMFAEYNEPRKGRYSRENLIGDRDTVYRTVTKTDEAVVKITSFAYNTGGLNNMVDYQARLDSKSVKAGLDPVALEDEQGNRFIGKEARRDVLMTWQGILDKGRREAFHIVLSMPTGTPDEAGYEAAKRLAMVEFKGFQYVMSQHHDTDNTHVHLVVHATPYTGAKRLSPGREDLRGWRESYAANLRELGVEVNATSRAARLVMDYQKSSKSLHREKRLSPEAEIENRRKANYVNLETLTGRVKRVYTEYMSMAQDLSKGNEEDRELSSRITGWVENVAERDKSRDVELERD